MIVVTTPSLEGRRITRYIGLVSGEAILGANIFRDLFAARPAGTRRPGIRACRPRSRAAGT